ncbi:MAG: recombinase RecT [Smithella sp.]|jgi:recombination protein RecT
MEQNNLPAQRKQDAISALLSQDAIKARFDTVLGKKAPGFMSSIISAVNGNKKLKEANPMTVISSAAVAASLDLPINPSLGFAHIVPYGGEAQFQMGWRGFVQLGMRTGQYKTINVASVHEGELISHNPFTGEMEFDASKRTSDQIIGYVAYFRLLNGFEKYLYMTVEETKAHGKRYSKFFSGANAKWQTDFDAMSMKTVLKMLLSKYGILSIDMQTAIQADQAVVRESGEYDYPDNPESYTEGEPKQTGAEALKAKLKAKNESDVIDADPMPVEMAPGPCEENPESVMTTDFCNNKCSKREGCPTWTR